MMRLKLWCVFAIALLAGGCSWPLATPSVETTVPTASATTGETAAVEEIPTEPDLRYDFGGFLAPGNWYKGNLHLHSTISDGKLDPLPTVDVYREAGYDFVALTDHIGGFLDRTTGEYRPREYPLDELNQPGFLVIPGIEHDTNRSGEIIHFVVVGPGCGVPLMKDEDLTHAVEDWWSRGAFVFLAHPHWSLNSTDVSEDLGFLPGIEMFNYGVEYGQGLRGYSMIHWDRLLRESRAVLGVATDDAHRPHEVSCGGWVVVKAEELTDDAIVEALRDGQFYASSGPELQEVWFDADGKIHVRCSPVKTIRAISTVGKGAGVEADPGEQLTEAVLDWNWKHWGNSTAPFVRVEVVDTNGRMAWSQAVFPK